MNKVIIYGSIGEPKFRDVNTKNGTREVCTFGICQQEGKDAQGNSIFAWYNVDMWLDKDSKLRPHIIKGARVIVDGELRTDRWKGQNGEEKSAVKIMCRNLTLTGERQEQGKVNTPMPATTPISAGADSDDDLPF